MKNVQKLTVEELTLSEGGFYNGRYGHGCLPTIPFGDPRDNPHTKLPS